MVMHPFKRFNPFDLPAGRLFITILLAGLLSVLQPVGVAPMSARPGGVRPLASSSTAAVQSRAAPRNLLQFSSAGHMLGFATDGTYAANGSHALHVNFVGAGPVVPQSDMPAGQQGQAAAFSQVSYPELWPGITLVYSTLPGAIYTTTYSLAPGADPAQIRLLYNAPIALKTNGSLSIAFETGTMTESAPIAWQEINGRQVAVDAAFQVHGPEVTLGLGRYDPQYALTIDPSLVWNTFLGGGGDDYGNAIAVDGSGNVYVTGDSWASWGTPVRAYAGGLTEAFVAKLDSNGKLQWNTFLGGSGDSSGYGISVDGNGNSYVAGTSGSTWGSPVRAFSNGSYDAFAAKLDSDGGLKWNTFLGGSADDWGKAIALDGSGNVYLAGYSNATWDTPVSAFGGGTDDAFAAKLNSSGVYQWHTFLGGSGADDAPGMAVDGGGNVYVTGESSAAWGSPVRAFSGNVDAFAAKLNTSGALAWNTFLGHTGLGTDWGKAIAVNGSGDVYVIGISFASWGSPVRAFSGGTYDTFAAKLDSDGVLLWNTFLGGSGLDQGNAVMLDGSDNVYVAGKSSASWGAPVRAYIGGSGADAYAAKLNSSGVLQWNTFLGGEGDDYGNAIAVDGSGNIYVAGTSDITWGAPVRALKSGTYDAFAAKLPPAPINFSSTGAQDGWVLESTETSGLGGTLNSTANTLRLGDDALNRQYRSILSFNTGPVLPDNAVISAVTLKVKQQGILGGGNPVSAFQGFMVDVRKGFFSSAAALQNADFQAATVPAYGPFLPGPVNGWYIFNLTGAKAYVNKLATNGGLTQIRLRFKLDDDNNAAANYLSLYSGDTPTAADRPRLIITYSLP